MSQKPYVEAVEGFNRTLKKLMTYVARANPGDALVERTHRRVILAVDLLPTLSVAEVGPYLERYTDEIARGDAEFFLASEYNSDIGGETLSSDVARLIAKVRETWAASRAEGRELFMEALQLLLDDYLDVLEAEHAEA